MALTKVKEHKLHPTSMVQWWDKHLSEIERDSAISQYVNRRMDLPDLTDSEREYIKLLQDHLTEEWGV